MEKSNQLQWFWHDPDGCIIVVTTDMVPEGAIGFVYQITRYDRVVIEEMGPFGWMITTIGNGHKSYIGKKTLTTSRKTKIGKRAQAAEKASRKDGKCKKVKRVIKESNWLTYNSSCVPLQEELKAHPERFVKEILRWCYTKKELSYWEEHHQHIENVLHADSWNDQIGGRYWKGQIGEL